jgi:hypothetical protein
MVDTTNPAKVAQHPMPLVDAVSLMEEVFDKKGWIRSTCFNIINRARFCK